MRYASEAVLPFYILHHPVVVIAAFWVVQWQTGIAFKYVSITLASFAATFGIYEGLVKRFRVTRWIFGMRPRTRTS